MDKGGRMRTLRIVTVFICLVGMLITLFAEPSKIMVFAAYILQPMVIWNLFKLETGEDD
jgi:hypothetical protein